MKDRPTNQVNAQAVERVNKRTLHGPVHQWTAAGATVYTDEASAYIGIRRVHEATRHSVKEYARGMASANGMESLWSMLKRVHIGAHHKMSPKHPHRHVAEFEGRHNSRPLDTRVQMASVARGAVGKRLRYVDLIGPAWTRNPAGIAADGIALLSGWRESKGATAEVEFGLAIGLPIHMVECWERTDPVETGGDCDGACAVASREIAELAEVSHGMDE